MNGRSDDGGVGGVGPSMGSGGADPVAATDASGEAQAVGGIDELGSVDADTRISEDLAAGRIDADQALAQLVDETLAAQLPADASPELVATLREEIASMLADDPTIAALLSPDV